MRKTGSLTKPLQFIRAHRDEPFFLYLPFTIPHLSIQVPETSLALYNGKIPEAAYEHRGAYQQHPTPRAGYAAMVSYMDRDIGKTRRLNRETRAVRKYAVPLYQR